MSFARKFGDKHGKKLTHPAKIGNKIADKITLLGKTKNKEKEDEKSEVYIPPEKKQKIIDDLRLF